MVVRCPFAEWRPLSTNPDGSIRQGEPAMRSHDIVCIHTMVGYLISTDGLFRSGGWTGTESHFGTGGVWGPDLGGGMDGKIFQWQDLLYQADANLDGNPNVISIENADNGAEPIMAFTAKQIDSLVRLIDWLCSKQAHAQCPASWLCHQIGIPRVMIPDTKSGRRGIGYHRQGIQGNYPDGLVAGGVRWSNAMGKTCPTDSRIYQIRNVIVPRVAAALITPQEAALMKIIDCPGKAALILGVGGVKTLNTPQRNALRGIGVEAQVVSAAEHDALWSLREPLPPVADIDEAELAAQLGPRLLTVLSPQAIADAIPDGLADQVADELRDRLAS